MQDVIKQTALQFPREKLTVWSNFRAVVGNHRNKKIQFSNIIWAGHNYRNSPLRARALTFPSRRRRSACRGRRTGPRSCSPSSANRATALVASANRATDLFAFLGNLPIGPSDLQFVSGDLQFVSGNFIGTRTVYMTGLNNSPRGRQLLPSRNDAAASRPCRIPPVCRLADGDGVVDGEILGTFSKYGSRFGTHI